MVFNWVNFLKTATLSCLAMDDAIALDLPAEAAQWQSDDSDDDQAASSATTDGSPFCAFFECSMRSHWTAYFMTLSFITLILV